MLFQFDLAIQNGFQCLDSFSIQDLDTYTLAVMAYAYTRHDPRGTRQAELMAELDDRKKDGEFFNIDYIQ